MPKLFPTSLVGSYPQPDWLIDRAKLAGRFPPRVRAKELWRVPPEYLDQAQDDATILAIATRSAPGSTSSPTARCAARATPTASPRRSKASTSTIPAPRSTEQATRIRCRASPARSAASTPSKSRDLQFLKANTDRMVKITVPGPFTMSQQAQNDFYKDEGEMALDYAAAVNEEIKDLFAAGADIVQIDEPYMQARPEKAREFGVDGGQPRAGRRHRHHALHICFGYAAIIHVRPEGYSFLPELADTPLKQISIETAQSNLDTSVLAKLPGKTIILGVIDLSDMNVETPEKVAERIRRALPYVPAEKIVVAPDCGLKYLPRDVAFGKMKAMVDGAAIVRKEARRPVSSTSRAAGSPRRLPASPAVAARARGGQAKSSTRPATAGNASPLTITRQRSLRRRRALAGDSRGGDVWLVRSPPASASLAPGSGSDERNHRADQPLLAVRPDLDLALLAGRGEQIDRAGADAGLPADLALDVEGELQPPGAGEVDAVAGAQRARAGRRRRDPRRCTARPRW